MAGMDRRLFLALAGGLLATPRQVRAWPAPPPLRRLKLFNAHTGESFDGPYRDDLGPIALAMEELSFFLRDHHSGERIAIDVAVVDFLAAVMDAVGATRHRAVGLSHARDQRDAGAHHLRGGRQQPAPLRPRPRHSSR